MTRIFENTPVPPEPPTTPPPIMEDQPEQQADDHGEPLAAASTRKRLFLVFFDSPTEDPEKPITLDLSKAERQATIATASGMNEEPASAKPMPSAASGPVPPTPAELPEQTLAETAPSAEPSTDRPADDDTSSIRHQRLRVSRRKSLTDKKASCQEDSGNTSPESSHNTQVLQERLRVRRDRLQINDTNSDTPTS